MSGIYIPRGRAGEYAELALNLYNGCQHGCHYCYAPNVMRKNRNKFHGNVTRTLTLKDIRKSAAKYSGDERSVLLCFTTDPYQPDNNKFTRLAIEALKEKNLNVTILTKGGMLAKRDLDLLVPGQDTFAVSLTCADTLESFEWEPMAAPPEERIKILEIAKGKGLSTWVSLEPVLKPEWTYELIGRTHEYTDLYKVGKMNYHPLAKTINWGEFGWKIVSKMKALGKEYYLKHDLKKEMGIE